MNDTIFGSKIISSIGYSEQVIIRDILQLHAHGKDIDLDPTYSIGNFYKKGLKKPKYMFDKFPQLPDVVEATADNLPLPDECCDVIMFDPPFVITGDTFDEAKDNSCIITKRFLGFHSFEEIKDMYSGSMKELYRILRPKGILIFKCQDVVACARNHFTHVWIMMEAMNIGYYPKDLFVLLSKSRLMDGRVQQHARKFHSYFWVFQKTNCKVDYKLRNCI